jgi:hypothetical protein
MDEPKEKNPTYRAGQEPAIKRFVQKATAVFLLYWKFAFERHQIYLKRLRGESPPWTDDSILREKKFTSTFRAADRTSQYCIKQVIYEGGSMEPEEVVFRGFLFKSFNKIETWELLTKALGPLTWKTFDQAKYSAVLDAAKARKHVIFNAAYMQRPQTGSDLVGKHNRYLALVEDLMRSGVTGRLQSAGTYQEAYRVLRDFPSPALGDFTAMQWLTDINYSEVLNFSENEFIIPGPGALDGINKCFGLSLSKDRPQDLIDATAIIEMCVDSQEDFFRQYGFEPVTLFGRRLHLIDCQSLFCETDKFSRIARPEFNLRRTEIKQNFEPSGPLALPYFPPKWGIKQDDIDAAIKG